MRPDILKRYQNQDKPRHKTFLDHFANDLNDNKTWFNNSEFARYHVINGVSLLSVFATNTVSQTLKYSADNDGVPFGINNAEGILYCRAQEVRGVKVGEIITLDGKTYQINKANLLQDQVWAIVLTRVQE